MYAVQLRQVERVQRIFQQYNGFSNVDEHSVARLLQLRRGSGVFQSTVPMSDAQIRRVSVLEFAQEVRGTGFCHARMQSIALSKHSGIGGTKQRRDYETAVHRNSYPPDGGVSSGKGVKNDIRDVQNQQHSISGMALSTALEQKVDTITDTIDNIAKDLQILKGVVLYTHYEAATSQVL